MVGEPRALRWRRVALVLAGQEPARQREERQQPHPVRLDRRHELALDVAHEKAVLVLARGEGIEVPRLGRPLRLDHLPGGEVRAADVADLALAHEIVERAQRLLDRRQRVGAVELVEVDPVGLEPPQAVLDRLHDVARASRPSSGRHRPCPCRTSSPARCPCGARRGLRRGSAPSRRARRRRRRCRRA